MDGLYNDFVIINVNNYLPIKESIKWMSVCKRHRSLIGNIRFNELVMSNEIAEVSYTEIFTNLCVSDYHGANTIVNLDKFTNLRHLMLHCDIKARVVASSLDLISVEYNVDNRVNHRIGIIDQSYKMNIKLVALQVHRRYTYIGTGAKIHVEQLLCIRVLDGKLFVPSNVFSMQYRSTNSFNEQLILANGPTSLHIDMSHEHDLIIPETVEKLHFHGTCRGHLQLPNTLRKLNIDKYCLTGLKIPPSVTHLKIGPNCTGEFVLPQHLIKLSIAYCGTGELKLPDSLKELSICNYDKPLVLPDQIVIVDVKSNVQLVNRPESTSTMSFPDGYPYELPQRKHARIT